MSQRREEFDQVKDSGTRQEWATGSVRDTNAGKGRFDLIPAYPMFRLANHFANGAVKYGDNNWRLGQNPSRYLDSAFRHLYKYMDGARDEDHLAAAVWNIMACIETEHRIARGELPVELADLPPAREDIGW